MKDVTIDTVRDAARRIGDRIVRTPAEHSRTLSEISGAEVVLKFENRQFTASFKERGALNALLQLPEEIRARGVCAMSAGNHAQAIAYHAGRLGMTATIVMPRFTPNVKVEHTKSFGAEVLLQGADLSEAAEFAAGLVRERGLAFVHPYDDLAVIAGQGTTALELLEDHPDLEALLVPVGGGGLAAGCAVAAHALEPRIEVYGVEASRFPSMKQALRGEPIECAQDTIAEGIAVKRPGQLTLPLLREHLREILLVDEGQLEAAVLLLLEVEKTVVEGAGAAALAGLLRERDRFAGRKVGVILSGGNIDAVLLGSILQRGLARSGRLVRLRVEVPDRPGALAELTRLLAGKDANVVEVAHQRSFTSAPLKSVEVEFVLQTRGLPHLHEVTATLEAEGFKATLPDSPS